MSDLPNIDALSVFELRQLAQLVDFRITELQEHGRDELIDRLKREAEALGFQNLDLLLGKPARRKKRRRRRSDGVDPTQSTPTTG